MKSTIILKTTAALALAISFGTHAAKPVDSDGVPFGNGFPSGGHFNLNLLGKKDGFNCPPPEYDEAGQQVLGNVIFIPREQGNTPITVLMESGSKGPKGAPDTASLEVTDWCTESFADYGQAKGDGATLRLPANDKGYAVYARITGKPGEEGGPDASISPDLYYVEDETGNDLILLGLVDRDGTAQFGSDGTTITRTSSDGTKGKGVQKATNITSLFEWSGEVCYVQEDTSSYCTDDAGNNICTNLDLCCTDTDGDGVYDTCDALSSVGELVDDGLGGTTLQCPLADVSGTPYLTVGAQCRLYDNEWVFNISDFVGYLWNLDSTGAYNIQVRFYPVR